MIKYYSYATAAVVKTAGASSGKKVKYRHVNLNRIFGYMIRDNKTKEILFMGKVGNPA